MSTSRPYLVSALAFAVIAGGSLVAAENARPNASNEASVGGIVASNGRAYVVSRLQYEMSLPDGSKVEPNGTIKQRDGSLRNVDPGKMLTIDGKLAKAPFGVGAETASPSEGEPVGTYKGTSSVFSAGRPIPTIPRPAGNQEDRGPYHQEPQTGIEDPGAPDSSIPGSEDSAGHSD